MYARIPDNAAYLSNQGREPSYLDPWAGEARVNNNNRNTENIRTNVTITRRELTDA